MYLNESLNFKWIATNLLTKTNIANQLLLESKLCQQWILVLYDMGQCNSITTCNYKVHEHVLALECSTRVMLKIWCNQSIGDMGTWPPLTSWSCTKEGPGSVKVQKSGLAVYSWISSLIWWHIWLLVFYSALLKECIPWTFVLSQ